MIRRSLLWGLTIVLVAALSALIIRARNLEKRQAHRPSEIFQNSEQAAIRVIAPEDLQISTPTILLQGDAAAGRRLSIHNRGNITYGRTEIRFVYLDRAGEQVSVRRHTIEESVRPGSSLEIGSDALGAIPQSAERVKVQIVFAEMLSTPPEG